MEGQKHGRDGAYKSTGLSFDIFQVEAEGVVWRGTAPTLEDANKCIQKLASGSPADYIVWNRRTGDKHTIKNGGRQEEGKKNEHIS